MRSVIAISATSGLFPRFAQGADTLVSWINGNGSWSNISHWTPSVVPQNGSPTAGDSYDTFINDAGVYTTTLDIPVTVNSLTLDASAASFVQKSPLTLVSGGTFNVNQGTYNLSASTLTGGTINVALAATAHLDGTIVNTAIAGNVVVDQTSALFLNGAVTFSGAMVHVNSTDLWVNSSINASTLTRSAEIVFDGNATSSVRGTSTLDIGSGITIRTGTGSGAILAAPLVPTITNRGTISAQTAGAFIEVGSTPNPLINLGTLNASNGGTLKVDRLTGDAGTLLLSGNSTLSLLSGSGATSFTISHPLNLTTGNSLILGGTVSINQPLNVGSGASLLLSASWTSAAPITVNGANLTIAAPAGGTYSQTPGSTFSVTNSNVQIKSATVTTSIIDSYFGNGNTVSLGSNGFVDNHGATLSLDNTTGPVVIQGGGIKGGTVSTSGSNIFSVSGGSVGFCSFYNVDFSGNLLANPGATFSFGDNNINPGVSINRGTITATNAMVDLIGQWQNQGTINLTGGVLQFDGPAISMGTVNVSNTVVNLDSNISVQQIAAISGNMNKLVFAGGSIDLNGGTFGPSDNTGTVYLGAAYLTNGALVAPGTNKFTGLRTATFDNITLATNLTLDDGAQLSVLNGLYLSDATITINNVGTQAFQSSGLYCYGFSPTLILGGNGQVVFDGPGSASAVKVLDGPLTIAPGITVRTGAGGGFFVGDSIKNDVTDVLTNQGIIRADGIGKQITFTGIYSLVNSGQLQAVNGGTILVGGNANLLSNWTNDGTIHLENGGDVTVTGNSFTNSSTGHIEGNGTLDIAGTTFTNNGYISPGLSPGSITINGNLNTSNTSVLDIQLGGTTGSDYDHLIVTGSASLHGTLFIELINGFIPSESDQFAFLTAASINGDFEQVISNFGEFDLSQSNSQFTLANFSSVPEPSTAVLSLICIGLHLDRVGKYGRARFRGKRRHE